MGLHTFIGQYQMVSPIITYQGISLQAIIISLAISYKKKKSYFSG